MTSPLVALLVLMQAFSLPVPSSLPPYVPPLTVLDDVLHLPQAEPPVVHEASVCYGAPAHLRLTLALQMAPALSDERARLAWLTGWNASAEASAKAIDEEHGKRVGAEDQLIATTARLQAVEQAGWGLWELLGAAAVVFLVGGLAAWGVSHAG